jgi:hypothetical protein
VVDETERAKNRTKSKVRARVEHPIGVIKRVFGFVKVRYRGLAKNTHRSVVTCALPICLWRAGIYCAASRCNVPPNLCTELNSARSPPNGTSDQKPLAVGGSSVID